MGINLGKLHINGGLHIDGTPIQVPPADQTLNQIVNGLEELGKHVHKIDQTIGGSVQGLRKEFTDLGRRIEGEISTVARQVVEEIGKDLASKLAPRLKRMAQTAKDEFATSDLNVLSDVSLSISAITLSWSDFSTRADTLIKVIDDGVKDDSDSIKSYINALAPTSVTISLDAAFALVVTTDLVSVGGSVTIQTAGVVDVAEKIVKVLEAAIG